jgi:hypothetical protein
MWNTFGEASRQKAIPQPTSSTDAASDGTHLSSLPSYWMLMFHGFAMIRVWLDCQNPRV